MPLVDFNSTICPEFNPDDYFLACHYYDPAETEVLRGFCKLDKYYRCIAHNGVIPLSHSSLQNYFTCHYLYYLTAIRGIQIHDAAKSIPLKLGTLWDSVLQKHLGGIDKNTDKPFNIPEIIKQHEMDGREVAKVKALYRAYKMLEVEIEPGYELQSKIDITLPVAHVWSNAYQNEVHINGFYDRKYPDHFVENKLSGRPLNYLDAYFIQSQIGTYFLADPSLQSCTMEITRVPDLKKKKDKEESDEEYGERAYQDILTRPSHYFLGWDPKTQKYGKTYYRAEFNLNEIALRFIHVAREIGQAQMYQGWYKNDKACNNVLPGIQCDFLPLCRLDGKFNESIYKIREKKIIF